MTNKRKHIRTPLRAAVNLSHASLGTITATMRDMSEGGLFVLVEGWTPPPVGSRVHVQLKSLLTEAPTVEAEVVRIDDEGVGLRFVVADDS